MSSNIRINKGALTLAGVVFIDNEIEAYTLVKENGSKWRKGVAFRFNDPKISILYVNSVLKAVRPINFRLWRV